VDVMGAAVIFLSVEAVSKPFITVVERDSIVADVETTDLRSCWCFGASALRQAQRPKRFETASVNIK
jgi:hypothetical protein